MVCLSHSLLAYQRTLPHRHATALHAPLALPLLLLHSPSFVPCILMAPAPLIPCLPKQPLLSAPLPLCALPNPAPQL